MNWTQKKNAYVQLVHIFVLGTFLLMVGVQKPEQTNRLVRISLLVLGAIAFFSFFVQMKKKNLFWVVWHCLVVTAVLIPVGLLGRQSFPFQYKLLILLGSAAIGYHTVRLVQDLTKR